MAALGAWRRCRCRATVERHGLGLADRRAFLLGLPAECDDDLCRACPAQARLSTRPSRNIETASDAVDHPRTECGGRGRDLVSLAARCD